jgi:hypothetical protein
MKSKLIKYVLILFFITCVDGLIAQPPPPGNGHDATNNQVPGGGAPVGNGTLLLIGMAGAYTILKMYNLHTEKTK